MTVNGRRRLRLFFKFGLLVSLPLAGYLWALTGPSPWTIGLGALCVVMALGAEGLASASEGRLRQLKAEADAEDRAFETEVNTREEKIRQMDRVVETLSNQNHDLRGRLVSLHGEVHRVLGDDGLARASPSGRGLLSEPHRLAHRLPAQSALPRGRDRAVHLAGLCTGHGAGSGAVVAVHHSP